MKPPVSPKDIAASLTELWSPRVVAEIDDCYVKVAKIQGTFVWHSHDREDDLPLSATAPVQRVVKCAGADGVLRPVTWVERFDWKAYAMLVHAHNREHIAQIQRILRAPAHEGFHPEATDHPRS